MRILAAALLLSGISQGTYADGEEEIADRIRKVGNVCIKDIECVRTATAIVPVEEDIVDQSAAAGEPVAASVSEQSAVVGEPVAENVSEQSAVAGEPVAASVSEQSAVAGESVAESVSEQPAAAEEPVSEGIVDQSATAVDPVAESTTDQSAAVDPVAEGIGLVKENYGKTCGICHDPGVANAPKFGDAEQWASRISKGKDILYMNSINGMPPAMPARGMCFSCSDDDLKALVDYMVDAASSTP